jgi:hypothetical protein
LIRTQRLLPKKNSRKNHKPHNNPLSPTYPKAQIK